MRLLTLVVLALGLLAGSGCGDGDAPRQPASGVDTTVPAASETPEATPGATVVALAAGRRRLAFISDREGPFHLYTMNPDGTDVRRLSNMPVEKWPFSVSRDGTQIAATGAQETGGSKQPLRVYRVDVAGGATTPIGEVPGSGSDILIPGPSWRSDDAAVPVLNYQICYEFPSGGGEVRERDFDRCVEANTIADGPEGRWAALMGDGLFVGTGKDRSGRQRIDQVLGADEESGEIGALAVLALQTFGQWRPLWSPDGTRLAYYDADAGDHQAGLAVIPVDGGQSRLVVPSDKIRLIPGAWSEDGATLFYSGSERESSIDTVDVNTGESHTLAGGDGHIYMYPRWVVEAPAPARPSVPFDLASQADVLKNDLASAPGRLVYEGGEGRRGFFSARPDGTDERRLSDMGAYPSFTSDDGHWLSYAGVIVDTTTGQTRLMDDGTASVSPSGRQVVFWGAFTPGKPVELIYEDLQTEERRVLYRTGDFRVEAGSLGPVDAEIQPAWSPDGRQVAFFRASPSEPPDTSTRWDLTVVDVDDGSISSVATTESELDATGPIAWSPDGSKIAFDDDVLRVVASNGGKVRAYGVRADAAAWSPDGTRIAVHGGGLLLLDAASGEATRLTTDIGGAVEYPPVWSPDGRWLAYVGADDTLRVMDVASRGIVRLGIEGDQVSWARP